MISAFINLTFFIELLCKQTFYLAIISGSQTTIPSKIPETEFSTITADGVEIFCSSGGSPSAPVILFLYGVPFSSHMLHNLIPLLSSRYYVIAPNPPGLGFTTVYAEREYESTFASLTHSVRRIISVHRDVEEVFPR